MNLRFYKNFIASVAIASSLLFAACSDRQMSPGGDIVGSDAPVVMFHIGTLSTGGAETNGVKELIKTLRIILVHEDKNGSFIESNNLIDTHSAPADADFSYIFQKRTVAGKKRVYLIANEQSVGQVSLVSGDFPSDMKINPTLHDFLEYFVPDMKTDGTLKPDALSEGLAVEFESEINSLHFDARSCYDTGGGVVYLPYSAVYTGIEIAANDKTMDYSDKTLYLVPVATKFTFKFINERTAQDVMLDYLAIASTHKNNFLMANLHENEITKTFKGESLYWIDWLKQVADTLQKNPSGDANVNLNARLGWISNYEMPFPADTIVSWMIPDGPADNPDIDITEKSNSFRIPLAKTDVSGRVTATETYFGPIYIPESHCMVEEEDVDEEPLPDTVIEDSQDVGSPDDTEKTMVEKYSLWIKLRNAQAPVNSESVAEVKTAKTDISNLRSLFRNTSVNITITLREGGVNIYAETVPWNKKVFYGYVKDEDEIK